MSNQAYFLMLCIKIGNSAKVRTEKGRCHLMMVGVGVPGIFSKETKVGKSRKLWNRRP